MDSSFKRIINFDTSCDIEERIEKWAMDNGFYEEEINSISNFDDVTYSYCINKNSIKTYVLISILDDKVLIEYYAIQDISKNGLSKTAVEDLLNQIKK